MQRIINSQLSINELSEILQQVDDVIYKSQDSQNFTRILEPLSIQTIRAIASNPEEDRYNAIVTSRNNRSMW